MIAILLINPPSRFRSPIVLPPLGLAYLAAQLKSAGYRVEILDAPALNLNRDEITNEVRRRNPEILGIGGMSPSFDLSLETIKAVRPFARNIVLGGPHASALRASLFKEIPEIDYLVVGEGEETFTELVRAIDQNQDSSGIPGIITRQNPNGSERPPIENLDDIPFPARELLPNRKYRHPASPSAPVTTLITSRGCPHQCVFCDKAVFGSRLRLRSPENVGDEIELITGEFGIRELIFYDDNFLLPADRAVAIAEEIIRRRIKIGFRCEGRVDGVTPGLLKALKSAGCHTIAYGIESTNPHGLEYLKKGFTIEEAGKTLEMTCRAGIRAGAYFILGIPVETREEMEKTIRFAVDSNLAFAQFSILSPTPGSELFRQSGESDVRSSGRIMSPFDHDQARRYLESPHWNESDLERLLKKAYRSFYLRPRFAWRFLSSRRSPFGLWPPLKSIGRTAVWLFRR